MDIYSTHEGAAAMHAGRAMIPTLFPDQESSIQKLRESLRRNKSVLLQGETGSGKSVMAAYMIARSQQKNMRAAFVVPRRDLLHQMSETFRAFEIPHSYVAANCAFNPYSNTHICTVGTLANRMDKISPNIIFFDECHYGAVQLDRLITYYKSKGAFVVGLSATPEKPDGRGLDEYYDDMVCGPTIRQLIELKRLSDYRLFSPSKPDLSRLKTVGGDYAKGELASFMENDRILIGDAVKHYKEHAMGKLNITFCTSIKHSEMTAEAFRLAGIPSVHMEGETPDDERRKMARAFAERKILNICSVDLMTFGYDLASNSGIKSAVIESISDLRPTKSRPLQRQKNGRALRYKNEPALIFDHSSNAVLPDGTPNHGFPCWEVQWSLKGRDKKKSDGERAVAVRMCSHCFFVHPPAPACPNCGHVYEVDSRMVDQVDGDLHELTKEERDALREKQVRERKMQQGRAETLQDLIAVGKKRGMKNPEGWARHVLAARGKK